jgi:hypothetical protein
MLLKIFGANLFPFSKLDHFREVKIFFPLMKRPSLENTKIENIVGILLKNEKLLLMYCEKKLIFCQSIRLPSHMLPSDIILSSGGRPHLPELVFFSSKK